MDLHPVAVTLARVTYLLAIGRDRLMHPGRGPIRVLSIWAMRSNGGEKKKDLFSGGNLTVETDDQKQLFDSRNFVSGRTARRPRRFNQIIESMTKLAGGRRPGGIVPKLSALLSAICGAPQRQKTLAATFQPSAPPRRWRDHIWSYYVRNLARPWWLSLPQNRVNALVGNPPWLAFRFMTGAMQEAFRTYSEERGLWHGAKVATHRTCPGCFWSARSSAI